MIRKNKHITKLLETSSKFFPLNEIPLTQSQLEWRMENREGIYGFFCKRWFFQRPQMAILLRDSTEQYKIFITNDFKERIPTHLYGIDDIDRFLKVVKVFQLFFEDKEIEELLFKQLENIKDLTIRGFIDSDNNNMIAYDYFG